MKIWKKTWHILCLHERLLVLSIYSVCLFLSALSGVYSIGIATVVDEAIITNQHNMVFAISVIFACMFVQLIGNYFLTRMRAVCIHAISKSLRAAAMNGISNIPFLRLDKEKPYELSSNIMGGAEKAAKLLCSATSRLIADAALVVVVWLFTLRLHPMLTMIYTLLSGCVASVQFFVSKPVEKKGIEFGRLQGQHDEFVNVFAQNMDVMHAMGKESVVLAWYNDVLGNFRNAFKRMIQAIFTFYPIGSLLGLLPKCIILVVGCGMVAANIISVGDVVGLLLLCQLSDRMLFALAGHISDFRSDVGQAARYFTSDGVENEQTRQQSLEQSSAAIMTAAPALILQNVSFSYGDRQVLRNISLRIEKGQRVVLLGRSGSGKSTLLRLIAGELQPNSGYISYNGHMLNDLLSKGMYNVHLMSNENTIFATSVVDNVILAQKGASREQIDDALNRSELVQKKYYMVANARELSGGEQQRIQLARSLLAQDVQIHIYDEPTNALDKDNRDRIAARLFENDRQGIVIIATHDEELAALADRVILIKDGMLQQWG